MGLCPSKVSHEDSSPPQAPSVENGKGSEIDGLTNISSPEKLPPEPSEAEEDEDEISLQEKTDVSEDGEKETSCSGRSPNGDAPTDVSPPSKVHSKAEMLSESGNADQPMSTKDDVSEGVNIPLYMIYSLTWKGELAIIQPVCKECKDFKHL